MVAISGQICRGSPAALLAIVAPATVLPPAGRLSRSRGAEAWPADARRAALPGLTLVVEGAIVKFVLRAIVLSSFLSERKAMWFPTLGFLNLGPMELVVIGIIALLIFGPRLPSVMRSLGKGIVEFKKGLRDTGEEINREIDSPSDAAPPRQIEGGDE